MAELLLLAKPDVPLVKHLEEVLRLGADLAERLGLEGCLRAKALLACALHDIGKATLSFQAYIRGERKTAYPHALASLPIVLVAERALNQHNLSAAAAVLSHHSPLGPELYKGYEAPDWHPGREAALQELWERLAHYLPDLPPFEALLPTWQKLSAEPPSGLLHEPRWFPDGRRRSLMGIFQELPPVEFAQVKAVLHLADWLASAKKPSPEMLFLDPSRSDLHAYLQSHREGVAGWTWREFQRRAGAVCPKDLWLRAPTGTGKTEALLLWARDAERLIYLLPTQATVNAMWRRLRRIYGKEAVGLAHGRASYMLCRESDESPLDMRLFGSVFSTPVTVATLDQYLLAHLNGRHWEERRTLAGNATVVLDEIHAYEPYTLGMLLEALERARPARLAVASATLPEVLLERFRRLFPGGELVEAEAALWQRRRHCLERREGRLSEEGLEAAVRMAKEGRSVLVVANTVRGAQELYQRLQEDVRWPRRMLLHSRFTFRDRQEKEDRVASGEPGVILVATQLVEVSLDISYDALVTELAPMDAVVQRMGRVNRRGEKEQVPVVIYKKWSEGSERVYGKEVLERSWEILEGLPEMPTDAELAGATHTLYSKVMATGEWKDEVEEGRRTLKEVQETLGCYTIDLSDEEMRGRFTARRGIVSIEVLPAQLREEAERLRQGGEGWRIPELLVPVPVYWLGQRELFASAADLGCIETSLPYDVEYGLHAPDDGVKSIIGVIFD